VQLRSQLAGAASQVECSGRVAGLE